TQPGTGYYTFVLIISLLAVFMGISYAPWMASFTETVEKRNPALIATGLAVWGWILRVVVALSTLILPLVISSMTPVITYGAQVQTLAVKYAPQLATAQAIDAKTQATLNANPSDTAALTTAVGEIAKAFNVSPAAATGRLTALAAVPKTDLEFLNEHATQVETASAAAPGQWKIWWWVCVGGMVLFLPFILVMTGRWSPRKAREDAEEHERKVKEELAALTEA
ncbi:MAG: MFS transporter, partial [Trebonia sp.]